MAKHFVVERTDLLGDVSYAYVNCVNKKGVWVLQGRVTWAANKRGGSQLVKPAAEAVLVLVPRVRGDSFRVVPV